MAKEEKEEKKRGWGSTLKSVLKDDLKGFSKTAKDEAKAWGKASKNVAFGKSKKKKR